MKQFGPTTVFLSVALLFGGIFVFLVPPFQSPDEPNHLLRAYQVSEGVFFPEKQDQRLGGTLPVSLSQIRDSFLFLKMNYESQLDKALIFRCLNIPLNAGERTFTDFPNTAVYAPTAYLPQAAAIALLRPLGATPLQMLYAARLANLFAWVLLVLAAIRLMPFLKQTLAALALLPASLAIAASANADVLTNGFCWWLTAAALSLWSGKDERPNSLFVFAKQLAALAVVCANKLITLPLMLLFWPKRRRHHLRFGIFVAVGLVAALAWGSFAQRWFISYDAYNPAFRETQTLNEGVDPARQARFILENPLFFAKTAAKSIAVALPSTAAHFVGKFGWEKNYLHPFWVGLLWLALAALLVSDKNLLSRKQRLLAAGVVVLFVGMFSVMMYALWCPVGAGEATNFQGRYFVPIAPMAALVVAGGWLWRFRETIWKAAFFVLTMSNLAMIAAIVERYYR